MNNLRIAIIIDTLNGGGAEKVCITLAKSINNLGHYAELIVLKKKCDYELPEHIHITFIDDDPAVKLYKTKNQKIIAEKLHYYLQHSDKFHLHLSNLDNCHPIVALHEPENTYYVIHNSIEHILKRASKLGPIKYWQKYRAFKCLKNKKLITVSKGLMDEITARGRIQPKSICTIYNPLDIQHIKDLAVLHDPDIPPAPYIIHIGRFAKMKRHDVLLKAFSLIPKGPQLVLLSNNSKRLQKLVKKYHLEDRVLLPGFKQNPYSWIRHAKALVLSSDFEGFGMVLAEALCCNTAVISTNCEHGPNEILTENLSNYLVPIREPKILAQKITEVLGMEHPPSFFSNAPILLQMKTECVAEHYLSLAIKHR